MDRMRELFETGAKLTPYDLENRLFLDVRNVREYLRILMAERFIYICAHRRDSRHGRWTPIYEIRTSEDQVDDIPPSRLTSAELRRRVRAQPHLWEAELQSARIRRKRKRFLKEGVRWIRSPQQS